MSRNLLESLIIILIALTFGLVLTIPKYQDLGDLKKTAAEKSFQLKNREDYFAEMRTISSDLKKYDTNLAKIKAALQPDPAIASFANFIQSASSQSGLILKNLTYGAADLNIAKSAGASGASKSYAVQSYDVVISLSGSYSAFKEFLSKAENSSRLIEVQEVSFTVSEASSEAKKTSEPEIATPAESGEESTPAKSSEPQRTYEFSVKLRTHYY